MHEIALPQKTKLDTPDRASVLPLVAEELSYKIDDLSIIQAVNLKINSGGCSAIMGYNGAGKSILLRLLHGLISPTSGRVSYGGLNATEARARQAMVFQTPLMLRRSVAANIRFALSQNGIRGKAQKERLDWILEETNLTAVSKRAANVLSGGERQRVALARALAPSPELVFLDEPSASLDPAATLALEDILKRTMRAGTKLVLVTQSLGQTKRLASEVIFLHQGKITEQSPSEEFLRVPRSREAQTFVSGQLTTQ